MARGGIERILRREMEASWTSSSARPERRLDVDQGGQRRAARATVKVYRERSWLDPRVVVGPSPIHNRGLFATAAIREGEVVAIIGGSVISDAELARLSEHSSTAIGGELNLLQASDDPLRHGNHSCDPNLWLTDEVTLVARRPIGAGEELTTDYATMTGFADWHMRCNCGSPRCRNVVRGTDWRLPDLQARYRGHFSPFLNERIASGLASG
jgi:hypothetical protein